MFGVLLASCDSPTTSTYDRAQDLSSEPSQQLWRQKLRRLLPPVCAKRPRGALAGISYWVSWIKNGSIHGQLWRWWTRLSHKRAKDPLLPWASGTSRLEGRVQLLFKVDSRLVIGYLPHSNQSAAWKSHFHRTWRLMNGRWKQLRQKYWGDCNRRGIAAPCETNFSPHSFLVVEPIEIAVPGHRDFAELHPAQRQPRRQGPGVPPPAAGSSGNDRHSSFSSFSCLSIFAISQGQFGLNSNQYPRVFFRELVLTAW